MNNSITPHSMSFFPQLQMQSLEDFLKFYFESKKSQLLHAHQYQNTEKQNPNTEIPLKGFDQLMESIHYSLFNGGKRFRPMVGYLLGESLDVPFQRLTPWLASIECVHTYSLIHDDLPSMDNDTVRRGKPTNHIVFGEATALLAGDALLTESFKIIAQNYNNNPQLGLALVEILSEASGLDGMVSGQALDLAVESILNLEPTKIELNSNCINKPNFDSDSHNNSDHQNIPLNFIKLVHHLKTGALIHSVTKGLVQFTTLSKHQMDSIIHFGSLLGFNFQIKDDLLDFDTQKSDPKNITHYLGLEKTTKLLYNSSSLAKEKLLFLSEKKRSPLFQLIDYNIHRTH